MLTAAVSNAVRAKIKSMTNPQVPDDPRAGSAVQRPLFTNEEAYNRPAAYKHNAPFATPGPYQTPLPPALEKQFRRWVTSSNVEFNPDDPHEDYDMRGYWENNGGAAGRAPAGNFFTDEYKTPYDATFSNLSKYATPDNPFHWKDGATLIDTRDGSTVFFNPSHYASEPGSGFLQTPPVAPPDVPGFDGGGSADTIVPSPNPPRIHAAMPGVNPSHLRDRDSQVGGGFERDQLGVRHPESGGEQIWDPYGRTQPAAGSGYGTRWRLEVVHANGQVSDLPLRKTSGAGDHTNWASDYPFRPGDQIRVKH